MALGLTLALLGLVEASGAAPADAQAAGSLPPRVDSGDGHVTADPLPTVQINGVVWDQEVVGNTVYAVGDFSSARPAGSAPGQNEVSRSNILAYNLQTGALIQSFAPTLNNQAKTVAASPDGSRIYVGGQFTVVNGINRFRIAALNPTTGAVITGFDAKVDYIVNDIVATDTTVYAGGAFNISGGVPRSRLAAFSATNGALLSWAPSANNDVSTMVMSPDGSKLFVGGRFTTINGSSAYGMAAINPENGALIPWAANQVVRNAGANAGMLSLTTDGTSIFGGGWTWGRSTGNLEGVFSADPDTGAINWIQDCHGDTYSVATVNSYVYLASHDHFCGNVNGFPQSDPWSINMRHTLSFTTEATGTLRREPWGYHNWEGFPAPSPVHWYPEWTIGSHTGQDQAARTLTATDEYLLAGGEFLRVNNVPQQGLVRFAVKPIAPEASAPVLSGGNFPINVRSTAPGQARISFPANHDRDDQVLSYRITRNGQTVHTTELASTYWDRPIVGFTDTGLTPGQTYTYRVFMTDSSNNTRSSNNTDVTIATSGQPSPYTDTVMADGARIHWRLDGASGGTTRDELGFDDGNVGSNVSFGASGALLNEGSTAATFNTSSTSRVNSDNYTWAEDMFSLEAWVRTSSSGGGRIVGFGNSRTGTSSNPDRMLYMTNNGRIVFGVYTRVEGPGPNSPLQRRTIESQTGLNNNQWHHVVGTLGPNGMRLYVDGEPVASRGDTNSGRGYYGYWRVGYDTLANWPSRPSSDGFSGQIDEVAIYRDVLQPNQVANHYAASGRGNALPTASFTHQTSGLDLAVDGSGSSDPDGTIASYEWDFGDGTTASGATASHTYAAADTYTVTLTVTDNDGGVGQTSQQVTVTEPLPNVLPTASFTHQTSGLDLAVDGSGSSDPDGTIASYEWDFGDGTTASGATASHTYAAADTYTVTLTVTDNDGGVGQTSQQVTVTEAVVVASDTFERQVTGGLGQADLGGPWTLGGSSADFAVNGGQGRITLPGAGAGRTARLGEVALEDADVRVDFSLDKAPAGGDAYLSALARSLGSSDYRLRFRLAANGAAFLQLYRIENWSGAVLGSVSLPDIDYTPGSVVHLRFRATGTGTTALAGKAWIDDEAEPANWQIERTDSAVVLQQAGGVGVHALLTSSVSNAPVVTSMDNLTAELAE